MKNILEVYELRFIWHTFWFMAGRVLEEDIRVGQTIQPNLPNTDKPKFTIMALETYGHALSEISYGISCQMLVQVPLSSDDDLAKELPKTFFMKAGS